MFFLNIMEICGFMTDVDQYGRLVFMLPSARCGKDMYGTYAKLIKAAGEHKGWSPLKKDSFVAKLDKKPLLLDEKGNTTTLEAMKQKMVKMEVKIDGFSFPTKKGWFITIHSMSILASP